VPPTNQQKHQAGRHLAVAEALLRGYHATLVGGSAFVEVNGHKALVQTATKGAWMITDVDKYTLSTIEHIILVNVTDNLRDFYICPGDLLRNDVRERHDRFLASHGNTRPRNPLSKNATISPQQVEQWCGSWDRLV
jgi:hypothetical protein